MAIFAMCPALQGCSSQGDTYEEVLENIQDAIRLHIEDIIESGESVEKINSFSLPEFLWMNLRR